jgi:hypothetical protein
MPDGRATGARQNGSSRFSRNTGRHRRDDFLIGIVGWFSVLRTSGNGNGDHAIVAGLG